MLDERLSMRIWLSQGKWPGYDDNKIAKALNDHNGRIAQEADPAPVLQALADSPDARPAPLDVMKVILGRGEWDGPQDAFARAVLARYVRTFKIDVSDDWHRTWTGLPGINHAVADRLLRKRGYVPGEDCDWHGRWTDGTDTADASTGHTANDASPARAAATPSPSRHSGGGSAAFVVESKTNPDAVFGLNDAYDIEMAIDNFDPFNAAKIGYTIPKQWADDIVEAARKVNLDPAIIAAIINSETGKTKIDGKLEWNPKSANGNAVGLGQFLKKTSAGMAKMQGTSLNYYCKNAEPPLVGKDNEILDGKYNEVMDLRINPWLSIMTTAEFTLDNLQHISKSRHLPDGVLPQGADTLDVSKIAYMAHHEGWIGALDLLRYSEQDGNDQLSEAEKSKQEDIFRTNFARQFAKIPPKGNMTDAQYAAAYKAALAMEFPKVDLLAKQYGSYAIAYRNWLETYTQKDMWPEKFQIFTYRRK